MKMPSVHTNGLSTEVQKYAAETLQETKETRKHGFDEIKLFALENPHLHIRTEEQYVLPFLRNCKFNIEKTKAKLKNFYIMKRDRTELFVNRNPHLPEIQELIRRGCLVVLKDAYKNQMVIVSNPTLHDPKLYTLDDIFKVSLMIAEVAIMENELGQIYGVICIVDLRNTSFALLKQFSISFMRHSIQAMKNYYCRPQKIAFVNTPLFLNVVLNMFKTFMPEKLRKRVHISYDAGDSLNSFIDKTILPEDYGGEGENLEDLANYWIEKLISHDSWFEEDEAYKAE